MTTIHELSVDLLDPHPHNPRRDLGDLTDLVKSIKVQGIRQNLLVTPREGACRVCGCTEDDACPDGCWWIDPDLCSQCEVRGKDVPAGTKRFTVVIGHRRLAAAKIAGLSCVPCVIEHNMTDADQLELMLLENIQRTDLTLIEEAEGYQGLLDLGLSEATIAKNVGRSVKVVHGRLALLALPETARERIHNGQGSLADAVALEAFEDDPETQERLSAKIGTADFARLVQEAKNQVKLRAEQQPLVDALLSAGATESADVYPAGLRHCGQITNVVDVSRFGDLKGSVFIRSTWSGAVTLYRPSSQSVAEDVEAAAAREAEWAAKRAAADALFAQEKAAREVRDEWIRQYLNHKMAPAHRDAIVAAASQRVFWGYVSTYGLGQWFGLDSTKAYSDKAVHKAFAEWSDGKPPAASLLAWLNLGAGTSLNGDAIPLYEALKTCGYVASEFEVLRVYGEPITDDEDPDDDA
jgi:ParB family transcriptional regulator, chromosome partitioning protein